MADVVKDGRFKYLHVANSCSIRDFVATNKLEFKPGRGFYQLTKPETIQIYKEIVARRKTDGSYVIGSALRKVLGIPETTDKKAKFKLDRSKLEDFDIFVQSTSYNRVLLANTDFLFEVEGEGIASVKMARDKAVAHNSGSNFVPPKPPGGPGSPLDIVFSFDTTGSMAGCIAEVRKRVQEVIGRLLKDIPGIRIAVFAHGDYCDHRTYVTKWVDFTDDSDALCKFVREVKKTGGGDYPECYELVLYQVRTELSWRDGSQRALVMIGDAEPHRHNEPQNYLRLDWREQCRALRDQMGCRVYSVECHNACNRFWKIMAEITNGHYLELAQFATVVDFLMAICYREKGTEYLEQYEKEVRKRENEGNETGEINTELHKLFATLKTEGSVASASVEEKNKIVPFDLSGTLPLIPKKPSLKRAGSSVTGGPSKKAKTVSIETPPAEKPASKKAPVKKTAPKKAPAKKAPAKKAPAKKAPAKKAPAKKEPAKKAPAKKASAKKAPAKKAPAKKAPAKKAPAKKKTVAKKGKK